MNSKFLGEILPLFLIVTGIRQVDAQKTTPLPVGATNFYNISARSATLLVGPGSAGRIRSLSYQGTELLFTATTGNWGSTLWPSPQAYWTTACRNANPPNNGCWPPPANLDADNTTYTGGLVVADTSVSYASAADASTGLRIRKTFWGNAGDSSFTNHYHLINNTAAPVAFGPWEITRFPGGGITFYPKAQDTLAGTAALINMVRDTLGVRWFVYDSTAIPTTGTPKIWGDGGTPGWYAHVDKNRVLFLKKFKDTPRVKNAPLITKESECELYTANRVAPSAGMAYQEMELQGSFDTIPAHDSVSWDVRWVVRKLPDSIAIRPGTQLLNFVNQAVAGLSTTALQSRNLPSPFGIHYSEGRISLDLQQASNLSLSLVNSSGREITRIHSGILSVGPHDFLLASKPATGIYWLVLKNRQTSRVSSVKILAQF